MKTNFFKSVLVLITLTFFLSTAYAQSPEKMSYQAVIRNSSDALVTNTQIGMEINIRQGSETGAVVYSETQTPTTNANGLVSIEIGGGTGFNTIDWASDEYFIETKTAIVPPLTTYTITGVSQLLSVPYALNAKTAESITGTITETDPVFTAWDKSTGISLTESQISDLDHFTTADETDPIYGASVASGITGTDTTNWNNKLARETDPIYTSSEAANITAGDITNLSNLSNTNTGDQDLSALATKIALSDSTAQVRSEIPIIPTGTATGDMQYWNGSTWVTVTAGTTGQLLSVNASGIPEWQNPSSLKSAATQAPTMTAAGVTFNGMLNANGYSTSVAFEYGTTTSYGATVVATQSPVSGTTNTAVTSAQITSLVVGTTYHVRMITQNIFGTFYGDDIEFTYLYYGASYEGGLVFSIDNSGKHGLVCATTDQSIGVNWSAAFTACAGNIGGYNDWYLPSKSTLNLMYVNLKMQGFGGFASAYWSSSESFFDSAWVQYFDTGEQGSVFKYITRHVRAVRAF
jgi:hypothetical protein